jgi:U3 small nucleolar RNA-associated protein 12
VPIAFAVRCRSISGCIRRRSLSFLVCATCSVAQSFRLLQMVLTKQYDRHAPEKVFGIIGSANATNVALLSADSATSTSRRVFVPACESVLLWDLKTHEQIKSFVDENSSSSSSQGKKKMREEAIAVSTSPNGKHLAVGYQTGMIKVFPVKENEAPVHFHGHKSTITTLAFTQDSATLVSGSKVSDKETDTALVEHAGPARV